MKKISTTLFILTSFLILVACSPQPNYDVVVSDYFTYDIINQVTDNKLNIKILQPIHMDYHTYEPSSSDLVDLKNTKMFIYTSITQSPWLGSDNDVKKLLGDKPYISFESLLNIDLEVHDDHDHHEAHHHDHDHGFDFISNPFHVGHIIQNLLAYLIDVFPEHAENFETSMQNYYEKLMDLVTPFHEASLDGAPKAVYFVGHAALSGFSEAFNLDIHAMDEGLSPNSDTTSAQVTNFIKSLKSKDIKVIYTEENPNLQTLQYIKEQIPDIQIYELHTFHQISVKDFNQNIGYLELIERNLNHLEKMKIQ